MTRRRRRSPVTAATLLLAVAACAGGAPAPATPAPTTSATGPTASPDTALATQGDTTRAGWVPAGFGGLRQDDVSIRLEPRDVLVRALPLDETVIRLLSPDSYRALHGLLESRRAELDRLASAHQLRGRSVWYVSFHGMAAEARFSPRDVAVTSAGREFRPLEVIPLTSGFGEQRLQARETQAALYLFEDGIDLSQPLTVSFGTLRDASTWAETLRTLERERALVRTRAASGRAP